MVDRHGALPTYQPRGWMIFLWFMNCYDINYRTSAGIPLYNTSSRSLFFPFTVLMPMEGEKKTSFWKIHTPDFFFEKPPVALLATRLSSITAIKASELCLIVLTPQPGSRLTKCFTKRVPSRVSCPQNSPGNFVREWTWKQYCRSLLTRRFWEKGCWPATLSAGEPLGF